MEKLLEVKCAVILLHETDVSFSDKISIGLLGRCDCIDYTNKKSSKYLAVCSPQKHISEGNHCVNTDTHCYLLRPRISSLKTVGLLSRL